MSPVSLFLPYLTNNSLIKKKNSALHSQRTHYLTTSHNLHHDYPSPSSIIIACQLYSTASYWVSLLPPSLSGLCTRETTVNMAVESSALLTHAFHWYRGPSLSWNYTESWTKGQKHWRGQCEETFGPCLQALRVFIIIARIRIKLKSVASFLFSKALIVYWSEGLWKMRHLSDIVL